jgi:hypothetical protein
LLRASPTLRGVLSLFTFRTSLPHSLPGAVRCNLCSVAASAHAAPATPVILGGIVEKKVAALVRAFPNQGRVPITEEVRCRLGKRREQGQRVRHFRDKSSLQLGRTPFYLEMANSLYEKTIDCANGCRRHQFTVNDRLSCCPNRLPQFPGGP